MIRLVRAALATCSLLLVAVVAPVGAQTMPAYIVNGDVVAEGPCIAQSIFAPGDRLVWRAQITNANGTPVTAAEIKAKGIHAVVMLKDGTKVELQLGEHPPDPKAPLKEVYWTAAWGIPADHPTGTLPWKLVVSDSAGAQVAFTPIGQASGATVLTIAHKAAKPTT